MNREREQSLYSVFPLYNAAWSKIMGEYIPVGLNNLGNTCYGNAVLQALTHSDLLYECIRSKSHSHTTNGDSESLKGRSQCVLCALENHIITARYQSFQNSSNISTFPLYLSIRDDSTCKNSLLSPSSIPVSSWSFRGRDYSNYRNEGNLRRLAIIDKFYEHRNQPHYQQYQHQQQQQQITSKISISPSDIYDLLPLISPTLKHGRQVKHSNSAVYIHKKNCIYCWAIKCFLKINHILNVSYKYISIITWLSMIESFLLVLLYWW